MPRFNDPTKSPHPADDNDRDRPDRFDAASPDKAPIAPAIHRFRKLLAELLVRRFLNERRGGDHSDKPGE
jgi:hypothetical protein